MIDKDRIENLEREKSLVNRMIQKGISFEVEDDVVVTERKFFGLIRRKKLQKVKRTFVINEPTLGTLDRISAISVQMVIDEEKLKDEKDSLYVSRKLVLQHAENSARIIALMVLNEKALIPTVQNGCVRYDLDEASINELTSLFLRTIKPSKLKSLTDAATVVSNLPDFMNSIRLMSTNRTCMPNLIEENRPD